ACTHIQCTFDTCLAVKWPSLGASRIGESVLQNVPVSALQLGCDLEIQRPRVFFLRAGQHLNRFTPTDTGRTEPNETDSVRLSMLGDYKLGSDR
ncbi:unnamed protein product, partial [Danaus chrysippus]